MKSILRHRPSPALVIACLALFVSLGGVSYGVATGFIDSREIQNNTIRSADLRNNQIRTFDIRNNEVRGFDIRNSSVQGRDVALNTLTGADISEQDLGEVPSATAADTAANATTVGGVTVQKFHYAAPAGSDFVQLFELGGLIVQARCNAGPALEVTARTLAGNSDIVSTVGTISDGDPDFDGGEQYTVINDPTQDDVAGASVSYAGADARPVTIQGVAIQETNAVGDGSVNDCGFSGIVSAG